MDLRSGTVHNRISITIIHQALFFDFGYTRHYLRICFNKFIQFQIFDAVMAAKKFFS